ncbi:MAG: biotin/lipoyl-containing protein, partial [Dysgonomonas sp.]
MAKFEIKMPKLGESSTEGTIISWSVKVGDTINEDDILFEVNTAKVSAEIPSPVSGKILEIHFKEGDTVSVGTVVAVVDLDGEDGASGDAENQDESAPAPTAETKTEEKAAPAEPAKVADEKVTKGVDRWYSPIVLQ